MQLVLAFYSKAIYRYSTRLNLLVVMLCYVTSNIQMRDVER